MDETWNKHTGDLFPVLDEQIDDFNLAVLDEPVDDDLSDFNLAVLDEPVDEIEGFDPLFDDDIFWRTLPSIRAHTASATASSKPKQRRRTSSSSSPVLPGGRKKGTLIRKLYKILDHLGGGGYGHVYLAKTPFSGQTDEDDFAREATILASLSHPHLPRVFDYFSVASRSYLVMEYIEGETIEQYLARVGVVSDPTVVPDREHPTRGRALPVAEVLDIGTELCAVLDYLHTHPPTLPDRLWHCTHLCPWAGKRYHSVWKPWLCSP